MGRPAADVYAAIRQNRSCSTSAASALLVDPLGAVGGGDVAEAALARAGHAGRRRVAADALDGRADQALELVAELLGRDAQARVAVLHLAGQPHVPAGLVGQRQHEHVGEHLERVGVALLARLAVDHEPLAVAHGHQVGHAAQRRRLAPQGELVLVLDVDGVALAAQLVGARADHLAVRRLPRGEVEVARHAVEALEVGAEPGRPLALPVGGHEPGDPRDPDVGAVSRSGHGLPPRPACAP